MNNPDKQFLSINQAAGYLAVTKTTLRRWDKDGSFKPSFLSPGGHRYYSQADLTKMTCGIFKIAQDWVSADEPYEPATDFYCPTSDIFKARNEKLARQIESNSHFQLTGSLISSASGEIGNNSFDHNFGNWPDIMGAFFAYDLGKHRLVLADRGQGALTTLRRVRPKLQNEQEALSVAFTEYVTGRSPEHRGNGLKYALSALKQSNVHFFFQSGDASLELFKNKPNFIIKKSQTSIHGCLALIEF